MAMEAQRPVFDETQREPLLESTSPGSPLARTALWVLGILAVLVVGIMLASLYWPDRVGTDAATRPATEVARPGAPAPAR